MEIRRFPNKQSAKKWGGGRKSNVGDCVGTLDKNEENTKGVDARFKKKEGAGRARTYAREEGGKKTLGEVRGTKWELS